MVGTGAVRLVHVLSQHVPFPAIPPTPMSSFLRRVLYIELDDGRRAMSGTLVCVDKHGNAILQEATEYTVRSRLHERTERFMPLVMIPGKHIVRVATPTTSSLYI